jgi:hypothetical protein
MLANSRSPIADDSYFLPLPLRDSCLYLPLAPRLHRRLAAGKILESSDVDLTSMGMNSRSSKGNGIHLVEAISPFALLVRLLSASYVVQEVWQDCEC